ncbi:hypothetical protein GCM10017044_07440 [Kordiimonas sediminis]|uniref:Uncharacterized protein n=1 Tax=Kordiimonas sediminis TaxID=1735581 RepID=A0A919AN10_9PROT|nr:hypothetical protein [Kordiimonas sediminis]GHF15750.1 hypothetical protein GCM10017044_07440 [Kordiimonas sediminis]
MKRKMDKRTFEELVVRYGSDPDRFPAAVRVAARHYCETAEGRKTLGKETRLDADLTALRDLTPARAKDDFLERLLALPDTYQQETAAAAISGPAPLWSRVSSMFDRLFNVDEWLTPYGIAGQAAMVVLVLTVGVLTGLQSPPADHQEIDLSANLVATSGFMLEEGDE